MKITWFGGRTLRIHIAGQILVWHPASIADIAREELESGADRVVTAEDALIPADASAWQPRRIPTALEPGAGRIDVLDMGPDVVLVDAPGEAPLLLAGAVLPPSGRWARDAIVVAFSHASAVGALDVIAPRLIALAIEGDDLDHVFAALRDRLGGTTLAALEPGLALEV